MLNLFFSRKVESLIDIFTSHIKEFQQNNDIFEKCFVIVPNPNLRQWLWIETARINNIAINLDFHFLDEGIWSLLSDLANDDIAHNKMIDINVLILAIVSIIKSNLETAIELNPIKEYIYFKSDDKESALEYRIWQIAHQIALFMREYEFQRQAMIENWNKGKLFFSTNDSNISAMETVQMYIYNKLFDKSDSGLYNYDNNSDYNFITLPQYYKKVQKKVIDNSISVRKKSIFIFGTAFLSEFFTDAITWLSSFFDINLYLLNPSTELYHSIQNRNNKKLMMLEKLPEIFLTKDNNDIAENPDDNNLLNLLNNPARKQILLFLMKSGINSNVKWNVDSSLIGDEPDKRNSILSILQRKLCSADKENYSLSYDNVDYSSIQVAGAPGIFREVESVYNSIIYNLEQDNSLLQTDISILCPDIEKYKPVIESVFARNTAPISYNLIDSCANQDSFYAKAALDILNLSKSTFSRKDVFGVIFNPCFLKAINISRQDALVWLDWADKLNIFHSFCKEDKQRKYFSDNENFTWELGLKRLRFGKIMLHSQEYETTGLFMDYENIVPYSDIYTQQSDLLDKFSYTIELLYHKLNEIREVNKSPGFWKEKIKELFDSFLDIPDDSPLEKTVMQNIYSKLDYLEYYDFFSQNDDNSKYISLDFIIQFIKQYLSGIKTQKGQYLGNGVCVSSLLPMRPITFKIIYILGMNEGDFPGIADKSTLDLRNVKRQPGDLNLPEQNKFLFLETLFKVRDKLYITYINKDIQMDKDFYPSSIVIQLLEYINSHIVPDINNNSENNEFITINDIPLKGWSRKYIDNLFNQESSENLNKYCDLITNYSISDRLIYLSQINDNLSLEQMAIVQKVLNKYKKELEFIDPDNNYEDEIRKVSLRELASFLINPAEAKLRKHIQIFSKEKNDKSLIEDEPFFSKFIEMQSHELSPVHYFLDNYDKKPAIDKYFKNYFSHNQLIGNAPENQFGEIEMERILSKTLQRIYDEEKPDNSIFYLLTNLNQRGIQYNNIKVNYKEKGDPVSINFKVNSDDLSGKVFVEIDGIMPFLWKQTDENICQTIVATNISILDKTNSKQKDINSKSLDKTIFPPKCFPILLFYIVARSGINPDLEKLFDCKEFVIHVLYKNGIKTFKYNISKSTAISYLEKLISEYLDYKNYNLLPYKLITKLKIAPFLNINYTDEVITGYPDLVKEKIDGSQDDYIPVYNPSELLSIININIPDDSFNIVRQRFSLIFSYEE